MVLLRHSFLGRTLTLLLLLLAGLDIGAHGLFASDFAPIATSGVSASMGLDRSGARSPAVPDHCFCHSVFTTAVVPAPTAELAPTGALTIAPPPHAPASDPSPLDRPPRLTA
jgi:hypothetical protein